MSLSADVDHARDLVDRLRMDRKARARGAVIVEGPSDETVISRAFAIDKRAIFPVKGRVNVLRVAAMIAAVPLEGVVCVADRDFDQAEAGWQDSWFLVFYDDADLEAMLIATLVLERFLDAWGSQQKVHSVGGAQGLRDRLRGALTPISALRAANAEHGWGLSFKALDLVALLDKKSLDLDLDRAVLRLAAGKPGVTTDMLRKASSLAGPTCPHTGRPLVRGKDLLAGLEVALRNVVASLKHAQVQGDFVGRTLRAMVGPGDLSAVPFHERFNGARGQAQMLAMQAGIISSVLRR
jgi:hypothetical protein